MAFRVLLVEDEKLLRQMTAEILRDEDYEVVEACDGDEAACLLDDPRGFDVLLTDVRMPGALDGLGVAAQARLRFPLIPVVVVSGYTARLTNTFDGVVPPAVFIAKPYSLEHLVCVVKKLTSGIKVTLAD